MSSIVEIVADCLVRAGSTFREDQKKAYRKAIAEEQLDSSCWVLKQILDNAVVAEERRGPLCDDTGIPHLFLEVGKSRAVTGEMLEEIKEGVRQGLRRLPGRPMLVRRASAIIVAMRSSASTTVPSRLFILPLGSSTMP